MINTELSACPINVPKYAEKMMNDQLDGTFGRTLWATQTSVSVYLSWYAHFVRFGNKYDLKWIQNNVQNRFQHYAEKYFEQKLQKHSKKLIGN